MCDQLHLYVTKGDGARTLLSRKNDAGEVGRRPPIADPGSPNGSPDADAAP